MTDDDDKIRLVSERDEKEIAAQQTHSELAWATKELAANILRVIAGAGKSGALITQIDTVLIANEKLKPLTDPLTPELAMEKALRSLNWRAGVPGFQTTDKNRTPLDRARDDIVQATLRLVAAQLSAQPTQESQSDNQLYEAINKYNEALRQERNTAKPLA